MPHNANNIRRILDQATDQERSEGVMWYHNAHSDAIKLHADAHVACGVIASISPGLRWSINVEYARRLIAGESTNGLGRVWPENLRKAYAILSGEAPESVLWRKRNSGHKVRAFYSCIMNPFDWFHCCVDGHAYGIWSGERIPLNSVPSLTSRQYHRVASDYWRVADESSLLASQVQAITWIVWRRLIGVDWENRIAA